MAGKVPRKPGASGAPRARKAPAIVAAKPEAEAPKVEPVAAPIAATVSSPVAIAAAEVPVAVKPAADQAAVAKPVAAKSEAVRRVVRTKPVVEAKPLVEAKPVVAAPQPAPAPIAAKAPAPAAPVIETPAEVPVAPTPERQAEAAPAPVVEHPVAPVAAANQPVEPEPAPAAAPEKEPAMDTVETTVAKTETMFADMNTRAKTAFEKSQKLAEEMGDFHKGNLEAAVESAKIYAKGVEAMGQDAAEFGRRSFEQMTAALKGMAQVKTPAELMKLHADYVRSSFDAAVAEGSKTTEAMIKLAGDVAQPVSSRFALVAEKVKAAA